jgi:hypothetical protein
MSNIKDKIKVNMEAIKDSSAMLYFQSHVYHAYCKVYADFADDLQMDALTFAAVLALMKHLSDFTEDDQVKVKDCIMSYIDSQTTRKIEASTFDELEQAIRDMDEPGAEPTGSTEE